MVDTIRRDAHPCRTYVGFQGVSRRQCQVVDSVRGCQFVAIAPSAKYNEFLNANGNTNIELCRVGCIINVTS